MTDIIERSRESAEGLYENAVELAEILEVFERAGVSTIEDATLQRLEHNIINARANLNALARVLGIPEPSAQPDSDALAAAAQLAYATALE